MTTWIEHVKAVYAKGKGSGMSYKAALKAAAKTWKKKGKGASKASKSKKSEAVEEEAEVVVKKKRRRRRKAMPKVPDKAYKNIDSIGMPKKM